MHLAEKDIDFRFHDVRDDGLDRQMLDRWVGRIEWEKLLNRQSLTWRKVPEVDRADMDMDKALALIMENPTLLKRPVLESETMLAVGFSEKRFANFLADNP